MEVLLVNARHVKNLPGRKTDVADATWLAQLCAHGLVRGSFPSVAADLNGASSRAMLEALLAGDTDPAAVADEYTVPFSRVVSSSRCGSAITSDVTIHGPRGPVAGKFLPAKTECFWKSRTLPSMKQV